MKPKRILAVVLLGFVAVSLGYLAYQEIGRENAPAVSAANEAKAVEPESPGAKVPAAKVIVYYFHGTQRCPTCRKLEAYSHEAVQTGFADALKDGTMEWRVVNVEEAGNRHFIEDYHLYTKSLVLVKVADGGQREWKNLTRIWELVRDQPAFVKYVQDEVSAYLTP